MYNALYIVIAFACFIYAIYETLRLFEPGKNNNWCKGRAMIGWFAFAFAFAGFFIIWCLGDSKSSAPRRVHFGKPNYRYFDKTQPVLST